MVLKEVDEGEEEEIEQTRRGGGGEEWKEYSISAVCSRLEW